jgi:cyclic pyranopterin monophosphate synthase
LSEASEEGLSHVDSEGRARMVDVGAKPKTARRARAQARVVMQEATSSAIQDGAIAKGAVLATARLAGIMAAKKTSELIPLCHPLELVGVRVDLVFESPTVLRIESEVTAVDRTGVEMEALTAAAVAALTIYDMCKAIDRGIEIRELLVVHKSGGKSGVYDRS